MSAARARTIALVVVFAASLIGWWAGTDRRAAEEPWYVVQVVDGDTVVVERRGATDTIRLLGVDTPNGR